jgi:membrane protease YdiL (CAAX protease family)
MSAMPDEGEKRFPSFPQAILVLVVCFLIHVFGAFFVAAASQILSLVFSLHVPDAALRVIDATLSLVVFSGTALVILACTVRPISSIFQSRSAGAVSYFAIMLLMTGSNLICSEIDNRVRSIFPMPDFLRFVFEQLFTGHPAVVFYQLVVVAAVSEELLFRGAILRGFLSRYRPRTAILASSTLFALYHLIPYQFPSAFLCGVLLGWVFWRTRNLLLCIYGHAFHNFFCWFGLYFPIRIRGWNSQSLDFSIVEFQPWWLTLTGILLLFAGWKILDATMSFAFSAPTATPENNLWDIPAQGDKEDEED